MNRSRVFRRIPAVLWMGWLVYLFIWLAGCWASLKTDGLANLFSTGGAPWWAGAYLAGSLELYAGLLWAWAGTLALKSGIWIYGRIAGRGSFSPPGQALGTKRALLCSVPFLAGLADAAYLSGRWIMAAFGLVSSGRGGTGLDAVLGLLVSPVAIIGGAGLCGACAAAWVSSVFLIRYLSRFVPWLWRGDWFVEPATGGIRPEIG